MTKIFIDVAQNGVIPLLAGTCADAASSGIKDKWRNILSRLAGVAGRDRQTWWAQDTGSAREALKMQILWM